MDEEDEKVERKHKHAMRVKEQKKKWAKINIKDKIKWNYRPN